MLSHCPHDSMGHPGGSLLGPGPISVRVDMSNAGVEARMVNDKQTKASAKPLWASRSGTFTVDVPLPTSKGTSLGAEVAEKPGVGVHRADMVFLKRFRYTCKPMWEFPRIGGFNIDPRH